MPGELGQAARYNLPSSRLNIPRVSFPDPPRLPIPQEEAIKAAGELRGAQIFASAEEKSAAARAQLIANIGNMLASLPEKVEASYWKGRQNKLRSQGMDLQGQLLSGDLSGVSQLPPGARLGPDGSVSYTPQTEEDNLRLQILRQRAVPEVDAFDEMTRRWNTPFTPPLGGDLNAPVTAPAPSIPATKGAASSIPEQATILGQQLSTTYGGRFDQFADRDIRGRPGVKSMHATGSAIDYFNDPEILGQVAEQVANPNTASRVIFNRRIWEPDKGWRAYNGTHPHTDHVHIEPVLPGAKTSSVETPYLDPFGEEISLTSIGAEPTAAPQVLRPLGNVGRNPATGGIVAPLSPTQAVEFTRGKQRLVDARPSAEEEGVIVANAQEAIARGYNPEGAEILPDGRLRVKAFKALPGQDAARTAKPTAVMQQRISDSTVIIKDLEELRERWEKSRDFSTTERAAAARTQKPSEGFFDGISRSVAAAWASGDAQELAFVTNRVNGLIAFARGGASLTASEKQALSVVDITDKKEIALRKINTAIPLIKKELISQVRQYPGYFPDAERIVGLRSPQEDEAAIVAPSGTVTAPPSSSPIIVSDGTEKAPIIITTRAQYDALKSGQYYIFNGRPGLKK